MDKTSLLTITKRNAKLVKLIVLVMVGLIVFMVVA